MPTDGALFGRGDQAMVPPDTLDNTPTCRSEHEATVVVVEGTVVVEAGTVVVVVVVVDVVEVVDVVVDDVVVVVGGGVLTRGEVKCPVLILAPPVLVQALPFMSFPGVILPVMESEPFEPTVSRPWKLQVVVPVADTPVWPLPLPWPFCWPLPWPFPPCEPPFAIATPPPTASISVHERTIGAIRRECFFISTSN
jgi:hypothetical protein